MAETITNGNSSARPTSRLPGSGRLRGDGGEGGFGSSVATESHREKQRIRREMNEWLRIDARGNCYCRQRDKSNFLSDRKDRGRRAPGLVQVRMRDDSEIVIQRRNNVERSE